MKASDDQLKYFSITGMFALLFQPTGPAVIRSLTDRLTVDAIKKPIRFIR